jgi:hypothetical protein
MKRWSGENKWEQDLICEIYNPSEWYKGMLMYIYLLICLMFIISVIKSRT